MLCTNQDAVDSGGYFTRTGVIQAYNLKGEVRDGFIRPDYTLSSIITNMIVLDAQARSCYWQCPDSSKLSFGTTFTKLG